MTTPWPFEVVVVEVGPLAVNAYIVAHRGTGKAAVVDPGDDGPALLAELSGRGLAAESILLTHGHFDHVGGVRFLKERTGATVYVHADDAERMRTARRQGLLFGLSVDDPPPPDVLLADGDRIALGDGAFEVAHTPGHTPGCVSFIAGPMAFTGDLIFAGSIGRTDLPGGDHDALIASVRERIFTLPDGTVLFPGHGPATTVGEERQTNPFFTGVYR